MNQEEQIKFLEEYFSSVYCDNCKYDMSDDACDYCHRKSMNWSLSHEAAEEIVKKLNED